MPDIPAKFCKYDPSNDNRTLIAKEGTEKGIHWTGLLDVDRTLYEAKSKHSIMLHDFAKFLKAKHSEQFVKDGGDLDELTELIEYCDDWEAQRRMISEKKYSLKKIRKILKMEEDEKFTEYSDGILETGNMSALAFGGMYAKRLEEYGREFMNSEYSGKFFDHTPSVIQKLRDHGIVPACVTGAPDFLVPAILEKIGVAHGHGMTYKMDSNGRLLSGKEAGIEKNMGTAEEKAKYAKALTKLDYAIAFAMGDSVGDMGIIKAAATKSRTKEDIHGAAVMINASENALAELERNYITDMGSRVRVVLPNTPAYDVVAAVALALRVVFEPLHKYKQPEQKESLLRALNDRRVEGKKDPNLENIKRIRDILKAEGLNEEEVTAQLERFYPEIVVEDVMKNYMLNLRDKNAVKAWLDKLIEVSGLSREEVFRILDANSKLQAESDSFRPTKERISSAPAAPSTAAEGAAALGEAITIPPPDTTDPKKLDNNNIQPRSETAHDTTHQIITPEGGKEADELCTVAEGDFRDSDLPPKDS